MTELAIDDEFNYSWELEIIQPKMTLLLSVCCPVNNMWISQHWASVCWYHDQLRTSCLLFTIDIRLQVSLRGRHFCWIPYDFHSFNTSMLLSNILRNWTRNQLCSCIGTHHFACWLLSNMTCHPPSLLPQHCSGPAWMCHAHRLSWAHRK